MEKTICIFGAGGHAKEVYMIAVDLGLKDKVTCFMESDIIWRERTVMGLPVRPFSTFNEKLHKAVIAVGDSLAREIIASQFPHGTEFIRLIHPSVIVSKWTTIGEGSVISAGSILTCDITIGKHAQINLNCTISHDCVIGDYFTDAPAVNISGQCTIGDRVTLGTNASIREKIRIADDVVVGMGAVVVKDLLEKGTYIGNPARKIGTLP